MTGEPLLDVRDLKVSFRTEDGLVRAVDGVSLTLFEGETLGIVGESGSGKSVTMMSVMRLINDPNARFEGEVLYKGHDLMTLNPDQMRAIRGTGISMIFQDPMTSLNPVYRVGGQIAEQIRAHDQVSKQAARARAIELLAAVGIPQAAERVDNYPHEFSGGMRQRVMIAMAVSCNPDILIADEPTTALDVTIQAQILKLLRKLRNDFGTAVVLIFAKASSVAPTTRLFPLMMCKSHPLGELSGNSAKTISCAAMTFLNASAGTRDCEKVFRFSLARRASSACVTVCSGSLGTTLWVGRLFLLATGAPQCSKHAKCRNISRQPRARQPSAS